MTRLKNNLFAMLVSVVLISGNGLLFGSEYITRLPLIKKDVSTGFSNGGWKYDRYKNLQSLDAHASITVADIKGPGIIKHIHTTRHIPPDLMPRGIVLEIYFDDAQEPAVYSPLADFFGDGCNGQSENFSSLLVECAPWSYNCYFPMPFKERAKVVFRNDTDKNAMNYSYVEWETLPEWKPDMGYFHATYNREVFQLTKNTDKIMFEVKGSGHIIGRQYSVSSNEQIFKSFGFIMEGNNEIDIDGQKRAIDYLGTEDSFTFSWGFRGNFTGLRAGMPLVKVDGGTNLLSIYRFHEHMPIRFNKELRWHINWQQEKGFAARPDWDIAVGDGGCWVDYATVYYWYQEKPGGFKHSSLPPVAERMKVLSRHSKKHVANMDEALKINIEVDPQLTNTFSMPEDMKRVTIRNTFTDIYPLHIDKPEPKGGHPGNPNPGRRGIIAVHPKDVFNPCVILRKVAIPMGGSCSLRVVTSGDPYEAVHNCDFILQAGIHDGKEIAWFDKEVVESGVEPSENNWRTLEYSLKEYSGKTVTIIITVASGGPNGHWANEEAFFDEISVTKN